MPTHTTLIRSLCPNHDPAHVEAVMRTVVPACDTLAHEELCREVRIAASAVDYMGPELCARLAASYATAAALRESLSAGEVDEHLDKVLRAAGSALRHYSVPSTLAAMRQAMTAAMTAGRTP